MGHFSVTLFPGCVALSGKRAPAHRPFWPARTPGQVRRASRSGIRRIAHSARTAFSERCARVKVHPSEPMGSSRPCGTPGESGSRWEASTASRRSAASRMSSCPAWSPPHEEREGGEHRCLFVPAYWILRANAGRTDASLGSPALSGPMVRDLHCDCTTILPQAIEH